MRRFSAAEATVGARKKTRRARATRVRSMRVLSVQDETEGTTAPHCIVETEVGRGAALESCPRGESGPDRGWIEDAQEVRNAQGRSRDFHQGVRQPPVE